MAGDILIPPDLEAVSPEQIELVDDATQVFAPAFARGVTQRISFGDPRWRILRRYQGVRAEDKARLMNVLNEARGRFCTVRTTPGYVQRGSFPSQELLANNQFANGTTSWSCEAQWSLSARDQVLRSVRQSYNASFFAIAAQVTGLTAYAPYIFRMYTKLGAAIPTTSTVRMDDYATYSPPQQAWEPLNTQVFIPQSTTLRPAIALMTPANIMAQPGACIDMSFASLTRCALVDTGINLIPYSDVANDVSWTKTRATITANTTVAPDGTTTADTLTEDNTAASTHQILSGTAPVPSTANIDVSGTICLKAGTRTWAAVQLFEESNNTAATTGCRMDSPLERQLRDAQQAANHMLISYRHYEQLGKTFLGHPPADMYLGLIAPV